MDRGNQENRGSSPAVERVVAHLLEGLRLGTYPIGRPLPKLQFFVGQLQVSMSSVQRAMIALRDRRLLHYQSRRWMAGPSPKASSGLASVLMQPRTLLLLAPDDRHWRSLDQAERTRRFTGAFDGEALKQGVQVVTVLPGPGRQSEARDSAGIRRRARRDLLSLAPTGRTAIRALVQHLGERYLGCLIAGGQREIPDLEDWFHFFLATGKPAVWFDRYDELPVQGRKTLGKNRNFLRCHFSETGGLSAALEYLEAFGHRRIGYLNAYPEVEWVARRGQMLRTLAARLGGGLEIVLPPPQPNLLREFSLRERRWLAHQLGPYGILPPVRAEGAGAYASADPDPWSGIDWKNITHFPGINLASHLTILAPTLFHLVRHRQVTALVCVSDYSADKALKLARLMGLRVPADVSLLSFDNSGFAQTGPFDSVDFGFEGLGYAAFHTLARDLPSLPGRSVQGRSEHLAARPRVVSRRSVGSPFKGPIRLRGL